MNGGKVAIIGARGVGQHGGFETVVAELAPRLKAKGYDVYCSVRATRDNQTEQEFRGVKLIRFPLFFPNTYSIGKIFEVLYDSYFVLKSKFGLKADVTCCLGVAPGFSLMMTKCLSSATVVNVDGVEWTRAKFGAITRIFLRASFIACCIGADRIVLDNRALLNYVPRRFKPKAVCITYGVTPIDCHRDYDSSPTLPGHADRPLTSGGYWLVVSRLEPENSVHTIVEGYLVSRSVRPLVIVGGASSSQYRKTLMNLAANAIGKKRVIMTGPIYNQPLLRSLRCGCLAYLHGHSVGGTNPSLLEAMSAGNMIICHDNMFNREVCSEAALYFSTPSTLANSMDLVDADPSRFTSFCRSAKTRADNLHQWDAVASHYGKLFEDLRSG